MARSKKIEEVIEESVQPKEVTLADRVEELSTQFNVNQIASMLGIHSQQVKDILDGKQ